MTFEILDGADAVQFILIPQENSRDAEILALLSQSTYIEVALVQHYEHNSYNGFKRSGPGKSLVLTARKPTPKPQADGQFRKSGWTPERRRAASERMKQRHLDKKQQEADST